eukprot:TRINITY_DN17537_c0_g1_i1.p1 TRINITY_DN17537_c0_g1~~TRINITY_DN17537_c0_g1_i1.p1  ORF type:complete len:344 (+),score=152.96 TRINITY_DN17537_c0_g1_i1:135-1166(+)
MSLTREMVKAGLSNLESTTDGSSMVYVDCDINDMNLEDVSLLGEYKHLLHLNISGNLLHDLRCLQPLTSLRKLRAGGNRIKDAADACPKLFALQDLDLSKNAIPRMSHVTDHKYLRKLCLDGNEITEMAGLQGLEHLAELSLKDNRLSFIGGLEGLKVRRLLLDGNEIAETGGVAALAQTLEELGLGNNCISVLSGMSELARLVKLDVSANKIAHMDEVQKLSKLPHLRVLAVGENPVLGHADEYDEVASEVHSDIVMPDHNHDPPEADYPQSPADAAGSTTFAPPAELPREVLDKYKLLLALQQLTMLNGEPVSAKDKRKALNAFGHGQQDVDAGAFGINQP